MRPILLLALVLLVAACAPDAPTCAPPYTLSDGACCMDKDADGACDPRSETPVESFSCDACPPRFVTERIEVPVYKYVCMNGSVVNAADGCGVRIVSDADAFEVNKEQDASRILAFEARPACRGKYRAAELHLQPAKPPSSVLFQVLDDPDGSFTDAFVLNGSNDILDDEYVYVGFCDDCEGLADITLVPDGAYVIRAELRYNTESSVMTRDLLLDPTPEGKYGEQKC